MPKDALKMHVIVMLVRIFGPVSSRPYFPVCAVVDGVIQDQGGDVISIDDLPVAVNVAEEEHIRFYTERENRVRLFGLAELS